MTVNAPQGLLFKLLMLQNAKLQTITLTGLPVSLTFISQPDAECGPFRVVSHVLPLLTLTLICCTQSGQEGSKAAAILNSSTCHNMSWKSI